MAEVETIEVLKQPLRAARDRIFMIPVIAVGSKRWYQAPALPEILEALDE